MEINIEKTIKNLKSRGWKVKYFDTSKEATDYLNNQIDGVSVGIGGSQTVSEMGLAEKLATHNKLFWHWTKGVEDPLTKALNAEVYLTSANGISEDGEIVNIDGRGNRVSAQCYGKKRLYVIAGINKIAPDLEKTISRAKAIACVKNAQRLNMDTPCVKDGKCHDCRSKDRICRAMLILFQPVREMNGEVVLIGENLGF